MSTVENDVASTICAVQNRDFNWFDTSLDNIAMHTSQDTLDCLHYSIYRMLLSMSGGQQIYNKQLHFLAEDLVKDLKLWEPTITVEGIYDILTACIDQNYDKVSLPPVEHFVIATGVAAELLPENPHSIIEILVQRHKRQ